MSGNKKIPPFKASSSSIPVWGQNFLEPSVLGQLDNFKIKAVSSINGMPIFVLSESGLGYIIKLSFVNGKSWDESTRSSFIHRLQKALQLDSQNPIVDYSYSFSVVRRQFNKQELDAYKKQDPKTGEKLLITEERINYLKSLSDNLQVQAVDLYFGITGAPSKQFYDQNLGMVDKIKSMLDKKIKYANESRLLDEVIKEFSDKVKQVISIFANMDIKTTTPRSQKDLLIMARQAWRPNFTPNKDRVERSLKEDAYSSPGDFIAKDLKVETYRDHWISDGCFNMLFSLDNAPDPNIGFSALNADRFLTLGVRPGISLIPYFGTYTVAWNSMTRAEGDFVFRVKNALTSGMVNHEKRGIFEDKMAKREALEINRMHEDFITGGSDMVRATVTYQLQIPLEHMEKFFKRVGDDFEMVRSASRVVSQQLAEIGFSDWRIESKTFYTPWINLIPGLIRCGEKVQYLPRLYLALDACLHLIPFYATVGPDADKFNGANYFITDENGVFTFDHFSKNNGTAANFSVCGATGSGKSVTVQTLVMMTEHLKPNIMILDFGGGNVGSWTKLCAIMGGKELKFGSAKPPLLNPFELSEADSMPNTKKKNEIWTRVTKFVKIPESDRNIFNIAVDSLYYYIRSDDSINSPYKVRYEAFKNRFEYLPQLTKAYIGKEMPESEEEFAKFMNDVIKLMPNRCRPGDKGMNSIRIVLELILANEVNEDGPEQGTWNKFSLDEINDSIVNLYEGHMDDKLWPQLTDFYNVLKKRASDGKLTNKDALLTRLKNYCVGGSDPFMDGQTDVKIMETITTPNGQKIERAAKFILADMAGISDLRRMAIYMITINEFMTNVLYNSKDSRGIMIRDEAWLFMKSKIASKYLEADYRLARKYGFSVITIAQQYSDFKSQVLQNNTQTWVICALASVAEIELADTKFKFNPSERSMFENRFMGTKIERDAMNGAFLDAYSRIMVSTSSGKFFVKNKIGKFERWVTTTDDNETFIFNYYLKKGIPNNDRPNAYHVIKWLENGLFKKDNELASAMRDAGRSMPNI